MTLGMIWAQDLHGTIGGQEGMLWHVPADFAYFKATTMGHPVVMGRVSWEALGGEALPGRRNIVVTGQEDYAAEGADVVHSLDEAIELARGSEGGELTWITGGGTLYGEAISQADLLHVSEIDIDVTTGAEELVFAPTVEDSEWARVEEESDREWRPESGDARWKVTVYRRR